MVDGSSVGAVELVIGSHDVGEVCIPLTPQSLRCVALLTQVPGITWVGVKGQDNLMMLKFLLPHYCFLPEGAVILEKRNNLKE